MADSVVQSNLQGRLSAESTEPAGVFPFVNQAAGRVEQNYLSFDWFLFAFFTFVNLLILFVLVVDARSGSVVKYRIPCSIYAAIAAVFATIRINDLTFNTGFMTSSAKALLASYYIQAIPYYLIPFLNGISFLDTVASAPAATTTATDSGYAGAGYDNNVNRRV